MEHEVRNDEGEKDIVVVLGWGNRIRHENVEWLLERITEAGYRVHVFEIPDVITDFDSEYLAPVSEYVDSLDGYRFLGHSTGGLIGAFLEDPETRVYLSPWWGFNEELQGVLLKIVTRLPVSRPILPAGVEKESLGDLATEEDVEDVPDRAAPTFLREVRKAQKILPAFDDNAVVFYTPEDEVVGVRAIEERAPEPNRVVYEGGHELFSSSVRDKYIDIVLGALDRGVGAIDV